MHFIAKIKNGSAGRIQGRSDHNECTAANVSALPTCPESRAYACVFGGVLMATRGIVIAAFLLFAASAMSAESGEVRLPRVVSLDSCADQYVLALADPGQIAAVSWNASLAFSYLKDKAADYPKHFGSMEELIALKPDIAIRMGFADAKTASMLERIGARLVATGRPDTIAEIDREIIAVGDILGQRARAEALVGELQRRRTALNEGLSAGQGRRRSAIYIVPAGVMAGSGTFVDDIIARAGLENSAAKKGLEGWGSLLLEELVLDTPDVVIGSFFDNFAGMSEGWRLTRHPVARKVFAEAVFVEVPSRLVICPAWFSLEAIEIISNAARRSDAGVGGQ